MTSETNKGKVFNQLQNIVSSQVKIVKTKQLYDHILFAKCFEYFEKSIPNTF